MTTDIPANATSSARLSNGGQFNGTIDEANDADWIALDYVPGQAFRIDLSAGLTGMLHRVWSSGPPTSTTLPSDGLLQLYERGQYFLEVRSATPGGYSVAMNTVADDVGNTPRFATMLQSNSSFNGRVDYSADKEVFKLAVQEGVVYKVSLPLGGFGHSITAYSVAPGIPISLAATPPSNEPYLSPSYTFRAIVSGYVYIYPTLPQGTTDYVVKVEEVGKDDFGDSSTSTGVAVIGTKLTGRVDWSDTDVINYWVEAGQSYKFEAQGVGFGSRSTSSYGLGYFTASQTGYHQVTVSNDFAGSARNYTLTSSVNADDYRADPSTTARMTIGTAFQGKLDNGGDRDWIAVELSAGVTYDFSESTGLWLAIANAAGDKLATLARTTGVASSSNLQFTPLASGTYFVEVGVSSGGMSASGTSKSFTVTSSIGTPDDLPATRTLALGATVTGKSESMTDTDTFQVELKANSFYKIVFEVADGTMPYRDMNRVFSLQQMDGSKAVGAPVSTVYDKGGVFFQAPASGTYQFRLDGADVRGGLTMREVPQYRITVIDTGESETTSPGSATPISLGVPATGRISVNTDTDLYTVKLAHGQSVLVTLEGAFRGGGSVSEMPGLSLDVKTDAHHTTSVTSYKGETSHYMFTAPEDGTYQLTVGGAGASGNYVLKIDHAANEWVKPYALGAAPITVKPDGRVQVQFSEPVMRDPAPISDQYQFSSSQGFATYFRGDMTHLRVSGDTLTVLHEGALMPGAKYTLSIPVSGLRDLAGNPIDKTSVTVMVAPGASAAAPTGDFYAGLASGAIIDGGGGRDTVVYQGDHIGFNVYASGAGQFKTEDYPQGDTLVGIERIYFTGTTFAIALDVDGNGGAAYRLYQAAFNRKPDYAGVGFWMSVLDQGGQVRDVAEGFVNSAEFLSRYGAQSSNADFVGRLYQNVLQRDGEPAGLDYWTKALDQGFTRADVLLAFSNSTENVEAVAKVIGNGFYYYPFTG